MAWCEAITQTAARQIAISSEIKTCKYFITRFAGKAYGMTLTIVIVDNYSAFVSKANLGRED